MPDLQLSPLTLKEACRYVARVHRHHKPPQGGLFAIGAAQDGEIAGVVIVGRPLARMLSDGYTAEVTRLATDGTKNCCSMLYAAAWRACRAMGYRRLVTYILASESGVSLQASGWKCVGQAGGGSWSRDGRPRVEEQNTQRKLRFEVTR